MLEGLVLEENILHKSGSYHWNNSILDSIPLVPLNSILFGLKNFGSLTQIFRSYPINGGQKQ
jgi:hypothetical protein